MFRLLLNALAARRLLRGERKLNKFLQRQLDTSKQQLQQEMDRNRLREESLLDRVLTSHGQHALPKLTLPTAAPTPTENPRRQLTAFQQEEREMWGQFAQEQGKPKSDGYLRWEMERLA